MAVKKPSADDPQPPGAARKDPAPAKSAERLAAAAMAGAQHAVEAIKAEAGAPVPGRRPEGSGTSATNGDAGTSGGPGAKAVVLPDLGASARSAAQSAGLGLLSDVNLHVKVELGRTRMYVEDVLRLNADSVIELDKLAGDPVDIYVNDRHVARGEVLVVNDNFCVRVSEIVDAATRGG